MAAHPRLFHALAGVLLSFPLVTARSISREISTAGTAGDDAFPVTVVTAFGLETVPDRLQRVVALGWGDAETALALGVQPVAASDRLAFGGEGVGPSAKGLYGTPPDIVDTLEPSFEQVAALQPDLILDVRSSGDADRFDTLSQIAPTVGIPRKVRATRPTVAPRCR